MKKNIIISVLLLLISCQKKEINNYNLFLTTNKGLDLYQYPMEVKNDSDFNEGITIENNGEVIESGIFEEGQKVGKWKYKIIIDSTHMQKEITWKKVQSKGVSLSLPENWNIIDASNVHFAAVFPVNDTLNNNLFLGINCTRVNKEEVSLETFLGFLVEKYRKRINFLTELHYKIQLDEIELFYSLYKYDKNSDVIISLSLLYMQDSFVYEVFYNDYDYDELYKYLLFNEIIRNIRLDDKKIFPYVSNKLKFTPINFP